MRILIAEDDFTSRSVLAAVLKKAGHELVETVYETTERARPMQPGIGPRIRGQTTAPSQKWVRNSNSLSVAELIGETRL